MRNLAKETDDRPRKPLPPVEKPTPNQQLGYSRQKLSMLIERVGILTSSTRLKIRVMNQEDVDKEIEVYTRLIETNKAA